MQETIIKRGHVKNYDSIEIHGPFDMIDGQVDILSKEILDEGKTKLVLDLHRVPYMTSSGIACIVKVLKKVQAANAVLYILGATEDMVELLTLARLEKYITFM
jgi:anti-anti-sigma factor